MVAPASAAEMEHFTAFAVNLSNVGTGGNSQVDITIDRWSSESERQRLVEAYTHHDQAALLKVLQSVRPPVGRIAVPGSIGWELRYAQEIPGEDGGRRILIATDRPIGFLEASSRPRSIDYPFTLIELRLDQDGVGEGRASVATKVTFDAEKHVLELENYASEPIRLQDVREVG